MEKEVSSCITFDVQEAHILQVAQCPQEALSKIVVMTKLMNS